MGGSGSWIKILGSKGFTNYTVFSLWDTYRALHPLFNLVQRDINADIINSMLVHYDKSVEHMLPIWSFYGNETWCMIGYHAVSVIADAIMKDVQGFDYERAYEAMKTTATNPNYDCLPEYTQLGWVPFDKEKESVLLRVLNTLMMIIVLLGLRKNWEKWMIIIFL